MKELKDAGCWNEDINSLDYQQGQDLFVQGKAAMIFGNDTFLAGWAKDLGWDKMGVMMVPKYGKGKLADTYVTTAQGWGITSWSKHPQGSGRFPDVHAHARAAERLVQGHRRAAGRQPAGYQPDRPAGAQADLRVGHHGRRPEPGELHPLACMDEQANFAGTQLLFAGEKTPEELAQLTEDVLAKWREQNPDAVKNFRSLGRSRPIRLPVQSRSMRPRDAERRIHSTRLAVEATHCSIRKLRTLALSWRPMLAAVDRWSSATRWSGW